MNKIVNHLPTAELQALDAAHHLHPFTDGAVLNAKGARVITAADGVTLTDSDGRTMLDAMAGLWCVNIGYGRKELAEVGYQQMLQLPYYNTFFQTSHVPAIELAAKLAEISPAGFNHTFFATGGSEANDTNIRMVRHYWAAKGKPTKKVIISRENAYHGSTMGGASLGGMKGMHAQGGLPIPDMAYIGEPDWYNQGGDMDVAEFGLMRARELEAKIEELGVDNVAAFIAEPVQGAGGVVVPPETYWPEIQRICDAHEILLIADEVICGFGRTGKWFGTDYYGIRPHIMTIAKGLSSGYAPIGGSMVCDEVANVINDGGVFTHGYTYGGHPVGAAVALENIRIMQEEKMVETAGSDTGPYLAEKWAQFKDHPLVGEVNMVGFMGSLVMTPDKSARAKFSSDVGTVGMIARGHCFENGLVMRHVGDRMIISPPIIINRAEIDQMFELALKSMDQTLVDIKGQGLYN
tara:strand:- start:46722 stop:48113 length:1392 start_codon:yes stop_codon:yes gene_type:complete